ncbi:hypothetical protein DFH27DRAFT_608345 [Peziza echinospora]|nr:hypothetical protein DFH27DRAFT_608345 [Peziza echinospora]
MPDERVVTTIERSTAATARAMVPRLSLGLRLRLSVRRQCVAVIPDCFTLGNDLNWAEIMSCDVHQIPETEYIRGKHHLQPSASHQPDSPPQTRTPSTTIYPSSFLKGASSTMAQPLTEGQGTRLAQPFDATPGVTVKTTPNSVAGPPQEALGVRSATGPTVQVSIRNHRKPREKPSDDSMPSRQGKSSGASSSFGDFNGQLHRANHAHCTQNPPPTPEEHFLHAAQDELNDEALRANMDDQRHGDNSGMSFGSIERLLSERDGPWPQSSPKMMDMLLKGVDAFPPQKGKQGRKPAGGVGGRE